VGKKEKRKRKKEKDLAGDGGDGVTEVADEDVSIEGCWYRPPASALVTGKKEKKKIYIYTHTHTRTYT
jgi:hypothetical protein